MVESWTSIPLTLDSTVTASTQCTQHSAVQHFGMSGWRCGQSPFRQLTGDRISGDYFCLSKNLCSKS